MHDNISEIQEKTLSVTIRNVVSIIAFLFPATLLSSKVVIHDPD